MWPPPRQMAQREPRPDEHVLQVGRRIVHPSVPLVTPRWSDNEGGQRSTEENDPTGRRQLTCETGRHSHGPPRRWTQHPLPREARALSTCAPLTPGC